MFKYLITVCPLGFLYGSAGAFLSPENLVGRSGAKFPPDASTLAGLLFSANKSKTGNESELQENLREKLFVAGPFWANVSQPEDFYVPVSRHKIIGEEGTDEWYLDQQCWKRRNWETNPNLEADYIWQRIDSWDDPPDLVKANKQAAQSPWQYLPMLHPSLKSDERHVRDENGLFLESAVQMLPNRWDGSEDDTCLVYLSTFPLESGWYRFGGESHLVEINSIELDENHCIQEMLRRPIKQAFALIAPGIWGSNHLSLRYPRHADFSEKRPLMLTDRPIPYRYRNGGQDLDQQTSSSRPPGRLSRGRYAVPPGTVYVFRESIDKPWWNWPEAWFPKEGFPLKHLGCNLCLPVEIQGVN